jgi:hypothetical protein
MKLGFNLGVLFFLILLFPESFQADGLRAMQDMRKSKKSANTKKTIHRPKTKIDKQQLDAKEIVEQFIDGVFVKRKVVETFERLTLFEACDEIDKISGNECLLEAMPTKFGHQINARSAAWIWRTEFGSIFYVLGSEPIVQSDKAYPYTSSEYESIKAEILRKNHFSDQVENDENSKKEIEMRLDEIEKNFEEIENVVFGKIDLSMYEKNILALKKSIKVNKVVKGNRIYYEASIYGPAFGFILSVKNGELKIIALEDGI